MLLEKNIFKFHCKTALYNFYSERKIGFKDEFLAFSEDETQLDTFYFSTLSSQTEFNNLWVVKKLS